MKKNILLFLFMLCMLTPMLRAQILSGGGTLAPGAPPAMIGVELGLGMHTQLGEFEASCRCEFAAGKGNGFLGGLLAQPKLQAQPLKTIRFAVWAHGWAAETLTRRDRVWTVEELLHELGNPG